MSGTRYPSDEDDRLQLLYDHRGVLPPAVRAQVMLEREARRPSRLLVGLALFVLLIGSVVADGLGWAELIADRGPSSDVATIVLALPAAYAVYTGRHGVRLGATAALTLAVGLIAVLVAVVLAW